MKGKLLFLIVLGALLAACSSKGASESDVEKIVTTAMAPVQEQVGALQATLTAPTPEPTPEPTLTNQQLIELVVATAKAEFGEEAVVEKDVELEFVLNEEGYPGPTTQEAKKLIGLDVQRIGSEPSAFVWRGVPNTGSGQCPNESWVCTLHLQNDLKLVFVGDGVMRKIYAGTFRFSDVYPTDDAVRARPPCDLVTKEQEFGRIENPSFVVQSGNFTCQ